MCGTCGCSDDAAPRVTDLDLAHTGDHHHGGDHHHDHGHGDDHDHDHHHGDDHHRDRDQAPATRTLVIEQAVMAKNDLLAARNRGWFDGRGISAVNVMSSPGSGKTTLLERTIRDLGGEIAMSVIEGDQETLLDAERIRATGARVVQVNTGSGCHLDADMLARGLAALDPGRDSLVLIENVGNLVCPALFDLGERARVVIMSVTEGADKPLKYPHMFRAAELMVLNKVDLLPYVDFDVDQCVAYARQVNPQIQVLSLSATRGDDLDRWYGWLRGQFPAGRDGRPAPAAVPAGN